AVSEQSRHERWVPHMEEVTLLQIHDRAVEVLVRPSVMPERAIHASWLDDDGLRRACGRAPVDRVGPQAHRRHLTNDDVAETVGSDNPAEARPEAEALKGRADVHDVPSGVRDDSSDVVEVAGQHTDAKGQVWSQVEADVPCDGDVVQEALLCASPAHDPRDRSFVAYGMPSS